eukprot:6204958-Pleurochrysis_carterae.AAC.1
MASKITSANCSAYHSAPPSPTGRLLVDRPELFPQLGGERSCDITLMCLLPSTMVKQTPSKSILPDITQQAALQHAWPVPYPCQSARKHLMNPV